jgi:hypothetical protein
MSDEKWKSDHSEMDHAFTYCDISTASPDELEKFLKTLCTGNVANESIKHREIIRGITINHIQMARTIQTLESTITTLNSENGKVSYRVLILTWICAGGTLIQAVIAYLLYMKS